MKKLNVLMLGGAKRVSVARQISIDARAYGLTADIYSYETSPFVPVSEIASIILGKSFSDPECLSDLQRHIHEKSIDIALSFHDASIKFLPALANMCFAPSPSSETIEIFSDKLRTNEFAKVHGIPIARDASKAPAIARPRNGSSSKGIEWLNTDLNYREFFDKAHADNFVIQEIASGPEFTVDGYVAQNSVWKEFAVRERLEIAGGEVTKSITRDLPEINELCLKIVQESNYIGPFTAQFIWDELRGQFLLMEVNSRFGGGMPTSLLAGIPWIEVMIADCLGLDVPKFKYQHEYLVVRSLTELGFSKDERDGFALER